MVIPFELDLPFEAPIFSSDLSLSGNTFVVNLNRNDDTNYFQSFDSPIRKTSNKSGKELTQNELLAEAVVTEKLNLKSLKEWQMLEQEKAMKKTQMNHKMDVPFIRYHSVAMPLIEELKSETDLTPIGQKSGLSEMKNYSRTFISFSDEETYKSTLSLVSKRRSKSSKATVCPVTRMPARYFDPISQLPYANAEAFRVIRDYYLNSLEMFANNNHKDVKQWIDWSHENKDKWKEWLQKHSSESQSEIDSSLVSDSVAVLTEKPVSEEEAKPSACRTARKRKKRF